MCLIIMNKIINIIIIVLFYGSSSYASEVSNLIRSNLKIIGSDSIKVAKTNFIIDKNLKKEKEKILKSLKKIKSTSVSIENNNFNRKPQITKGVINDIFKDYGDAVVYIENRKDNGSGSGFIIEHNGLKIITNWHVVENAKEVIICLRPKDLNKYCEDNNFKGKIVKKNKIKDLAMIEVLGLPKKIKPVIFGKFEDIEVGDEVFAIGHPNGFVWSFTDGRVSALRPNYDWPYENSNHKAHIIQMSAAINAGNSGGPLFNIQKQLIGVNTFTYDGESLSFAVSADDLIEFINEVKQEDVESQYIQKKKKQTWITKKSDKEKKSGLSKKYPNAKKIDSNENGIADGWLIDKNKNGIFEIAIFDFDENDIIETVAYDENEDNNFEIIYYDDDNDGNADRADIDENEDGKSDFMVYDYNQDGEWDKYEKLS
jgi:S1-C subfamily serine protease